MHSQAKPPQLAMHFGDAPSHVSTVRTQALAWPGNQREEARETIASIEVVEGDLLQKRAESGCCDAEACGGQRLQVEEDLRAMDEHISFA
jgi:hypothetical protein